MKATNYHNEETTFAIGQSVTHVDSDGNMVPATITGFCDDLLELSFCDGSEGYELPSTCF